MLLLISTAISKSVIEWQKKKDEGALETVLEDEEDDYAALTEVKLTFPSLGKGKLRVFDEL